MASVQPGTSRSTGPVTRKRRQLEEQEEKRREKEEMAKKVKKNTKTNYMEVDKSTGKIKTEVKQEPEVEEEQIVVIVKEEVEVPMDNAGNGGEEDLGGILVGFQESVGAERILKGSGVAEEAVNVELGASEGEATFSSTAATSRVSRVSVGVGTDLLASHFVPLEEFNKLKEELRRTNEEWNKRFGCLEASFQALQQKLGYSTLSPKDDQPVVDPVDMVPEKEPGILDTEELNGGNSAEPEDDRTLTLFPGVIEVIWDKNKYSMFNKADFLKSRLVCSTWKLGIDKIINGPCECLNEKRDIKLFIGQFLWKDGKKRKFQYDPDSGIILDSPVQPTKLTIQHEKYGYFATSRKELEESAKCLESIEEFLQKHGHSIKKFICGMVKDSPHFENKEDMQRTLSRWLNLMPNLEKVGYSNWLDDDDIGLLELDQFPTLPKLKFLDNNQWPNDFFRTAVLNNPQINSLKVYWTRKLNFKNVGLPGLRELDAYSSVVDLNLLLMQELHAPLLETLRLGTAHWRYPGQAEAVYEVLNKFRESLQVLEIHVELKPGEVVFPAMLRLRQLDFTFAIYSRDFCMDDFDRAVEEILRIISSSCPSLEHLVLAAPLPRDWGNETRRRRKRVEVQLFSKLKFWEVFPSLKKVELKYLYYAGFTRILQAFVFIRKL